MKHFTRNSVKMKLESALFSFPRYNLYHYNPSFRARFIDLMCVSRHRSELWSRPTNFSIELGMVENIEGLREVQPLILSYRQESPGCMTVTY